MKRIISLMYHDVYIENPSETGFQSKGANIYKLKIDDFDKQISSLVAYKKKYEIRLTFDDGGISFHSVIAPILEKYGFKGFFFISTDFIGTKGFLNKILIKDLHNRGHEIGPHSCSHPRDMTKLPADDLYSEWNNSKNIIEQIINKKVDIASIPSGFYDKKVVEIMSEIGFHNIYTSVPQSKIRENEKTKLFGRFAIQNFDNNLLVSEIIKSKKTRSKIYLRWYILNLSRKILGNYYFKLRNLLIKKID